MTSKEKVINYIKHSTGGAIALNDYIPIELCLSVLSGELIVYNNQTCKEIPDNEINWDKVWEYIKNSIK